MKSMIKIVHLTPHLGGGVGKALSSLMRAEQKFDLPIHHTFMVLEKLEKKHFAHCIAAAGGEVIVEPTETRLKYYVMNADIVQLEWWNHPATFKSLCQLPPVPIRLLIWCHQSGLSTPVIPRLLIESAHRFILTSPCSFQANSVRGSVAMKEGRIDVISSGAGCETLPLSPDRPADKNRPMSVGYLGSLNFSKLHPDFIDWLVAVNIPEFKVRIIGEPVNRKELEYQCAINNRPGLLKFIGYKNDIISELSRLDVLVYLLNPFHYGTAENALLEAMAMGVVPIVLNNSAEKAIVQDRKTGFIVSSPLQFADQIECLQNNLDTRLLVGKNAANTVRNFYTEHRMGKKFDAQYKKLVAENKKTVDFKSLFGEKPSDWFLSCQSDKKIFNGGNLSLSTASDYKIYGQIEHTKGSAFHFFRYFPEDYLLKKWCDHLSEYRRNFVDRGI